MPETPLFLACIIGLSFILLTIFTNTYLRRLTIAEENLNNYSSNFYEAQTLSRTGSFSFGISDDYVYFSPELKRMFPDLSANEGINGLLGVLPTNIGAQISGYAERSFVHDELSVQFDSKLGKKRRFHLRCFIKGDLNGTPERLSGTIQNITEIISKDRTRPGNELKYRSLFDHSPIPSIFFRNNKISDCNPRAVKLFGLDNKEEMIGSFITDWSPVMQSNGEKSISENIRHGKLSQEHPIQKFEWLIKRKDGTIVSTEMSINSFMVGNNRIEFARIQDLSEQKAREHQIRELVNSLRTQNDLLEKKVQERTASLKSTNKDLQKSNLELEQFAYAASHDLQEPLRMVGSFVQLLEFDYGSKLDQSAKEYIAFAVDGVRRMSGMIHALLDYSRVGKKEICCSSCDVGEIVNGRIMDLSKLIEESSASVVIKALPNNVAAEQNMLGQVFQNLISNGIKFNKSDKAKITISSSETDTHWRFQVADNGIGIAEGNQDKIFQIFKRLHRNEEFKGTGIGLSLCRKVVELHGGKIWFESKPDEGTTFYFTIQKGLDIVQKKQKSTEAVESN